MAEAAANPNQMLREANKQKAAGDLEGAVETLEKMIELAPQHVAARVAISTYLERLGRKDEALEHAKKVPELEPEDAFSFTHLSVICQRCGLIPEAEDAMAKARMIQMRG
ncbi:MAG: tetratricopeptide repeat protein [Planctomycetota bacterium]